MSNNIIERLGNRFKDFAGGSSDNTRETPDMMTRDIGGDFRENQPFISGYHQIIVMPPPTLFGEYIAQSAQWLHSTCESFTPHSVTPNMVDVMGIGQIGSSFVASKTITREFTTAHREYQFLPIMNIIDMWHSLFDEHVGVSPLKGLDFIPINYKGKVVVYQLKPVGAYDKDRNIIETDLEEFYVYQGVYPKTNPRDTIGAADQAANDTVQLSVTWSFDGAPLTMKDKAAVTQAINLLNDKHYFPTYELYNDQFTAVGKAAAAPAGAQVA